MADILVHNAIKDVQQAIDEGTTNIQYSGVLGSELYDYIKAIIDANKPTGPAPITNTSVFIMIIFMPVLMAFLRPNHLIHQKL